MRRVLQSAICLAVILLSLSGVVKAQSYDLLIRNGHVIDPRNKIDGLMDVAVRDGRVAKVAAGIPVEQAGKVVDATGLFVVPGLIDMHTHVFAGAKPETFADGFNSVSPDDITLKAGVTTVVDAGTSGWRNFPVFKEHIIDKSRTRVLAFLNIAGNGMTGAATEQDESDMDAAMTAELIKKYPETLVGVKIGHYAGRDWAPFDRALEAASSSNTVLFVECHLPQYSLEDQLKKMRPGDIITHSFEKVDERMPVTDSLGRLRPFVLEAQKRGILFDLGHGGAGFWYSVAIPAMKAGLPPNTFGSDLHRFSMNAGMKDMMNILSKYMAMGMTLQDAVQRGSWNAAKAIHHEELGNFSAGSVADIAVLRLREGSFGFVDAGGNVLSGTKKLETELTVRNGKIVWDLNGISAVPVAVSGHGDTAIIRKTADFTVTGRGDDPAWSAAPWQPLANIDSNGRGFISKSKMLYSPTGIYVFFTGEDQAITTKDYKDNEEIYEGDVFEFFFHPEPDKLRYFEYEINPLERQLVLTLDRFPQGNMTWAPWKHEADRHPLIVKKTVVDGGEKKIGSAIRGWSAEVYVPYTVLGLLPGVPPKSGAVWKANFCRIDYDGGKTAEWSWSRKIKRSFHELDHYETIRFE